MHVNIGMAQTACGGVIMREGIIYDCRNANCTTPIYTGKCSKACFEKYNKVMGIKPQTDEERIRELEAENKQLHLQLETITKDRDYYRDAYHHLLREGKE